MRQKSDPESLEDDSTKRTIILARDKSKFQQKFELLKLWPDFENGITYFRKKWGVNLDNQKIIEIDTNDQKEFEKFLKKHKLTNEWNYLISIYIQTGEFEKMGDPGGIQIQIDPKKRFANIKVYPETTLLDIKKAYKIVTRELKDGKIIKTTPAKNFERDNFIYELRTNKRKSYKEIRKLIGDNYNDFLDDNHLGRIIDKVKKRRLT